MEIILLENIDHVGRVGDQVTVRPGYARNYLFPKGKATVATPENIAKFESRRAELELKAADVVEKAQIRAREIQDKVIAIQANMGPEGRLFGSVGANDIAAACEALGLTVERSKIRLPDGPIRVAGEHTVEVHLHVDVDAEFTVRVEGGMGQGTPKEESGTPIARDTGES